MILSSSVWMRYRLATSPDALKIILAQPFCAVAVDRDVSYSLADSGWIPFALSLWQTQTSLE